ncbi:MAG: hypothetical protein LBR27_01465 [Bifidobacteriaceae bacterium]|jgi:hypothetical protein|nr:hypothetical protein [Bifidobacteriaceae bacterium]
MTPQLTIARGEVTPQELAALTASLAALLEVAQAGAGQAAAPATTRPGQDKARAQRGGWTRAKTWRGAVTAAW